MISDFHIVRKGKNMRILIVSQSFYPDNFKINNLVKDFSELGHDITVLSGLGDYTTGKINKNYRFFKNRTEMYNGVTVKRVRTISRRKGPIFRSLNYISFAFFGGLWGFFSRKKFDLVYVYQPSPATMIFPGVIVAKKLKIPLLIYCLDIWPEAVKAMSIKEETIAYKIIHRLSRWLYRESDFILVSSKSFMKYLYEVNGISYSIMSYLPQHSDYAEVSEEFQKNILKKRAAFNFVFTGNIGFVQDVETIIRATTFVEKQYDYIVHIIGDGSNLECCKQLAKKLGVTKKIIFYGRKPASTMHSFYLAADACLLTLKYENKIGLTIPAKLQGYMSESKPIIAAIEGDARAIIEEANCGICVNASDSESYGKALMSFMDSDDVTRGKFGKNAFLYYQKHFTKNEFIRNTNNIMEEMIKDRES